MRVRIRHLHESRSLADGALHHEMLKSFQSIGLAFTMCQHQYCTTYWCAQMTH